MDINTTATESAPFVLTERAQFTLAVAERIRKTGFRFDKSWRHADINSADLMEASKAAFYEKCCTFAANDIADDPTTFESVWMRVL